MGILHDECNCDILRFSAGRSRRFSQLETPCSKLSMSNPIFEGGDCRDGCRISSHLHTCTTIQKKKTCTQIPTLTNDNIRIVWYNYILGLVLNQMIICIWAIVMMSIERARERARTRARRVRARARARVRARARARARARVREGSFVQTIVCILVSEASLMIGIERERERGGERQREKKNRWIRGRHALYRISTYDTEVLLYHPRDICPIQNPGYMYYTEVNMGWLRLVDCLKL